MEKTEFMIINTKSQKTEQPREYKLNNVYFNLL